MSYLRTTIWRFFLIVAILCRVGNLYAQWPSVDKWEMLPIIDTSDYIPSFYPGALDYNLMIASSKGYASEIERLIWKGANINGETDEGVSPLVFAVSNNKANVIKLLIRYGADVNKKTSAYETPLLIAVKNQNAEIMEALIRAGSDIEFSDRYGATPLHYASIYGYFQLADMLLYYEASVNNKTVDGTTPLLASIWAGYPDIADLLIQNGANMETRDNEGYTPFLMAAFYGDTLLLDMLYKKGVDVYAVNKSNHNALTLSILNDNIEATKFLLKIGDRWTNSGSNAVNPYSVASKYRRKEVIKILENNKIQGHFKYEIDQVAITASSRFNLHDIYTGVSLSFKEPYLNGGIIAGCDMKLWYTRVLKKDSEYLYYQYMDKGAVAYAGLYKDFTLTDRPAGFNYSISTSLLAGYTFGNKLKGTLIDPENTFTVIPSVSFKMTKMNFSLNLGMEYLKTSYYRIGPVWLRIGSTYNLFFDNVRIKNKTIRWY
jgi:ankyrin repeat protein